MTLAEFRILYNQFSRSAHVMECRDLYWPEWVQFARLMLRANGRRPRRGGRGL